jgi:hypothetical protein
VQTDYKLGTPISNIYKKWNYIAVSLQASLDADLAVYAWYECMMQSHGTVQP